MPQLPQRRTDNGRRRQIAAQVLVAAILDGMDDDTLILGVTITTSSRDGEYVQHSAGLRDTRVRRHLIPPGLRADLDAFVDRLVDLGDLPEAPDSPGWLP